MTLGEKIKYFRTRIGITQGRLAELCDIHPVSIRKYETNKMIPQQAQIDRVAQALGISSFALTGTEANIQLNTHGDFMGLFFWLYKAKVVTLEGDRNEDGMLDAKTAECKISPFLAQYFNFSLGSTNGKITDIAYRFNSSTVLQDLLRWEKIFHGFGLMMEKYGENEEPAIQQALAEMRQDLEMIELELQCSRMDIKD